MQAKLLSHGPHQGYEEIYLLENLCVRVEHIYLEGSSFIVRSYSGPPVDVLLFLIFGTERAQVRAWVGWVCACVRACL